MADVLFTHSYFYRFDPKQWNQIKQPYPPLGTIWAASYLRENGYTVALHDTNFAHGADEVVPKLDQNQPRYLVIYDDGFNFLTKMCLAHFGEAHLGEEVESSLAIW